MEKFERLLLDYEITDETLSRVREYGKIIVPRLDSYIVSFYRWLEHLPEYEEYFLDLDRLERVQKMQILYWKQLFEANIDENYLDSRRKLGESHAHIGLSLSSYFAGMNKSLSAFSIELYDGSLSESEYIQNITSLTKLVHFETGIVVDSYAHMTLEKSEAQTRAMMEMSTPVTAIWDDVLMLPIVGILDSKRAQELMYSILSKISVTRSKILILDISGVAVVDTAVANHIIKITKATKLMGCECTLSGISPAIAQTIIELGIDVGSMSTTSTLRDALEIAFNSIGVNIGHD
jgi:rsbT co-antagonist protein RsbR